MKKKICPLCGSDEVFQSKKGGWLFLITSLLFLFPTPFFKKSYHCFGCDADFNA